MSLQEEQDLEQKYVMHTFGRMPLELVRGRGMYVWDDTGKKYTDFLGGIAVCALGHCNVNVVNAIKKQADTLMHVSNYFYIEGRGEVAKQLNDMLNESSDETSNDDKAASDAPTWQTFFANSGAEANECAFKLARMHAFKTHSGATNVVVLDRSFHGRTMETLAATAQPEKQEAFQPMPGGFLVTPRNDIEALRHVFAAHKGTIAGMMVECIQGESGVHPCTKEFLQEAEKLTHEAGGLFMCDEVQCGMLRTGKPFGFQNFGIVPDVVSMAKGIANGFPMGACAAQSQIAKDFGPGDHGSTFGGSNLAIAAAHATLHQLQKPQLADHVQQVGTYLKEQLATIPATKDVRGYGLMVGCDLDDKFNAFDVVDAACKKGFILNATGAHTLRFVPPLVCSKDNVDGVVDALKEILA